MEKWKPVKGYEDYYEVSNMGRIRNKPIMRKYSNNRKPHFVKSTINKPTPNQKGYMRVFLSAHSSVKTKYVHRLVAEAWCDNSMNYREINHKDSDKTNNNCDNLEWVSRKQNVVHSRINETFVPARTKLNSEQVLEIVSLRENNVSRIIISKKYNISTTGISRITSGDVWSWLTGIKKKGVHHDAKRA